MQEKEKTSIPALQYIATCVQIILYGLPVTMRHKQKTCESGLNLTELGVLTVPFSIDKYIVQEPEDMPSMTNYALLPFRDAAIH